MKNLFLKLPSWSVFLLLVLLPGIIFLSFGSFSAFTYSIYSLQLIWIYSIAIYFSSNLNPKPKYLSLTFVISLLYILYYSFYAITHFMDFEESQTYFLIHFSIQIVFMVSFIYLTYQAAKGIRTFELKQQVLFRDAFADLFCLIFFPIGIWFIQPRVRKYFDLNEQPTYTEQKTDL